MSLVAALFFVLSVFLLLDVAITVATLIVFGIRLVIALAITVEWARSLRER